MPSTTLVQPGREEPAAEHQPCYRRSEKGWKHSGGLAWVTMGPLPARAGEQGSFPGTLWVRGEKAPGCPGGPKEQPGRTALPEGGEGAMESS